MPPKSKITYKDGKVITGTKATGVNARDWNPHTLRPANKSGTVDTQSLVASDIVRWLATPDLKLMTISALDAVIETLQRPLGLYIHPCQGTFRHVQLLTECANRDWAVWAEERKQLEVDYFAKMIEHGTLKDPSAVEAHRILQTKQEETQQANRYRDDKVVRDTFVMDQRLELIYQFKDKCAPFYLKKLHLKDATLEQKMPIIIPLGNGKHYCVAVLWPGPSPAIWHIDTLECESCAYTQWYNQIKTIPWFVKGNTLAKAVEYPCHVVKQMGSWYYHYQRCYHQQSPSYMHGDEQYRECGPLVIHYIDAICANVIEWLRDDTFEPRVKASGGRVMALSVKTTNAKAKDGILGSLQRHIHSVIPDLMALDAKLDPSMSWKIDEKSIVKKRITNNSTSRSRSVSPTTSTPPQSSRAIAMSLPHADSAGGVLAGCPSTIVAPVPSDDASARDESVSPMSLTSTLSVIIDHHDTSTTTCTGAAPIDTTRLQPPPLLVANSSDGHSDDDSSSDSSLSSHVSRHRSRSPKSKARRWRSLSAAGNGVVIKKSNIPILGKGLFATRQFVPGEWITEYAGTTILSQADAEKKTKNNAKAGSHYRTAFSGTGGQIIAGIKNASKCKNHGAASFANDAFNQTVENNASFHNLTCEQWPLSQWLRSDVKLEDKHPAGVRVFLKADKLIQPGEEIFASYGDSYWNRLGIMKCKRHVTPTNENDSSPSSSPSFSSSPFTETLTIHTTPLVSPIITAAPLSPIALSQPTKKRKSSSPPPISLARVATGLKLLQVATFGQEGSDHDIDIDVATSMDEANDIMIPTDACVNPPTTVVSSSVAEDDWFASFMANDITFNKSLAGLSSLTGPLSSHPPTYVPTAAQVWQPKVKQLWPPTWPAQCRCGGAYKERRWQHEPLRIGHVHDFVGHHCASDDNKSTDGVTLYRRFTLLNGPDLLPYHAFVDDLQRTFCRLRSTSTRFLGIVLA